MEAYWAGREGGSAASWNPEEGTQACPQVGGPTQRRPEHILKIFQSIQADTG